MSLDRLRGYAANIQGLSCGRTRSTEAVMAEHDDPTRGTGAGTEESLRQDPTRGKGAGTEESLRQDPTRGKRSSK
jgi:hypothetical protein